MVLGHWTLDTSLKKCIYYAVFFLHCLILTCVAVLRSLPFWSTSYIVCSPFPSRSGLDSRQVTHQPLSSICTVFLPPLRPVTFKSHRQVNPSTCPPITPPKTRPQIFLARGDKRGWKDLPASWTPLPLSAPSRSRRERRPRPSIRHQSAEARPRLWCGSALTLCPTVPGKKTTTSKPLLDGISSGLLECAPSCCIWPFSCRAHLMTESSLVDFV